MRRRELKVACQKSAAQDGYRGYQILRDRYRWGMSSYDGSAMEKVNRRDFMRTAAAAPIAAQEWWSKAGQESKRRLLFVGTQTGSNATTEMGGVSKPAWSDSKGIYAYHWDPENGELKAAGLAAESDNPTFLALDPNAKYLYAANEITEFEGQKSGAVSAFTIDRAGAKLTAINQVASLGPGTCHVAVDHIGRAAFCANYAGGSMSSFYLNPNGQISDAVSHFQFHGHGTNPERQEAPHVHRVTVSPDDRFLLANDLGLDCIHVYHLEDKNARLTPNDPPQWNATPGSGPRALQFHPNGKFAYCVCEMASEVDVLRWDAEKGTLHEVQKVSLIPEDYHGPNTGDDIVLDRSGHFAYAADRFYDGLTSFSIDPGNGKLTVLGRISCGGKTPRHLTLDPTEKWVLVANQDSDDISVLARDGKSGKLTETGKKYPLAKPQCLLFV
jgi:6-phosphogluconolactonase